ncbi:MAG: chemotaxis protein CheD [Bacillota bacterium]|nr:chemotaxis protein CheD [Bacillota bacterium]
MQQIIGIGEYTISNNEQDSVKTFALSSCVALTAYSPYRKVLGMVHIALPETGIVTTCDLPGYYADTAVPLLVREMCTEYGCLIGELTFQLYGGAKSSFKRDVFKIGERNIQAVKAILASYFVKIEAEDTGGIYGRTIEADVATGKTRIEYNAVIL